MAPVADSQGSSGQQTAATPVQKVSSGARQSQATVSGPWTINLASSPRKTDITRLAALAATADIPTRIEEAEVKGRHYWRLQTGGYPSYAAARTGAEPIKAALELDSVWILKRETGR